MFNKTDLALKETKYITNTSTEIFLEYVTRDDSIAAFLRLSLPTQKNFIEELSDSAIIREVHVYGQSIQIGKGEVDKVQHSGLGKKLIAYAQQIAKKEKFKYISVISSVGTRMYYKKLGFEQDILYQKKATTL